MFRKSFHSYYTLLLSTVKKTFIVNHLQLMRLQLLIVLLTCALVDNTQAQTRFITGKVTADEDGIPLPGVSILIKNSLAGTITDAQGRFNLPINTTQDTLVFSLVGRQPVTIQIGNQTVIDLKMALSTTPLNEVVVIGYGNQVRRQLTGSVSSIPAKQVKDVPLVTPDQILQGRASGVWVTQNSGTPASGVRVRVRGINSLDAGAEPLYVVDGMPVSTSDYSKIYTGGQSLNALSNLNPADIASVEVLKDAAAAAIYGSRAANGVVLITTKQGSNGPTQIDLRVYEGVQNVPKMLGRISGQEQEALINEQRAAIGLAPRYPEPENATTTDWQREVFRSAPIREYTLSVSGGNQQTRFLLSGTYFRQQGIVIGSDFNRGSIRLNFDHQMGRKLHLGSRLTLSRSLTNRINGDNFINGILSSALFLGSHIPVRNQDGSYALDPFSSIGNPVAEGQEPTFDARSTQMVGTVYAEYQFLPGLSWRTTAGADNIALKEDVFFPTTTLNGARSNGSGRANFGQDFNWLLESTLRYTADFENHSISALAGAGFQKSSYEEIITSATNFPDNSITRLIAGTVKTAASSNGSTWGLTSFFSRLQYTFRNNLLVSATVRTDGSSRFAKGNRYGVFPVASVGYIFLGNEESKPSWVISFLKTRASYGLTGNNSIGTPTNQTPALGIFGVGENYAQQTALVPTQLANPNLSWEKTREFNLGVDIGLFNNRLSLSSNYFIRQTNDLLQERQLPSTTGFFDITENIGSLRNRGVEVEVSSANLLRKDWQWSTNFTVSFIENKITALYAGTPFSVGYANWVEEGQPIGAFYGYQVERIFQSQTEIDALNQIAKEAFGPNAVYQSTGTRPGDIQFKDLNGDGRITGSDQKVIGSAQPDFYGGFTNNLVYRNFDLSAFFQFTYGNEIYNSTRSVGEGMNSQNGQLATVRNRWTPENPSTTIPRAVQGDPNNNRRVSDRFLEDGSFLRLKNLSVGYTLPNKVIQSIRLRTLRIYAAAQNLVTWTNYSGYDPEVNTLTDQSLVFGSDFQVIPQPRTFLLGLHIGL